ncbi:MAG: hypothetical protein AAFY28_16735 [Actinomycetota bacterium]
MTNTLLPVRVRSQPVAAWFRNRWNWRKKKRMRVHLRQWEQFVVPYDELDLDDLDSETQRMACAVDQIGISNVLHYGYGMSEALAFAVRAEPELIGPLIESAAQFTDRSLIGDIDSFEPNAVEARMQLIGRVAEVVSQHPKAGVPPLDLS